MQEQHTEKDIEKYSFFKIFTHYKIEVIMMCAMKDDIDTKISQDDSDDSTDVSFEETELEELEENSKDKIKQLKQKLKECEKEKMESLENLQRAKAEFLNAKRRVEEEKIQNKERATVIHVEKLLPLCDSFYMSQNDTAAWEAVDPLWKKGFESIFNQLQSLLLSYGVQEVNPHGEMFDPALHDAVTNIRVTNKEDHGRIISVIQNGFVRTVHEKKYLIRPARVIVGEYTE